MSDDALGDRMKGYEQASRTVLPGRLPVIVRVDGKAFHTYTRGCDKPFDAKLTQLMIDTAKRLCEEIQGAVLAYTQSDEISVLVHGYKRLGSQAWFDNQVQKMVSVAAATASSHFTANSWHVWHDGEGSALEAIRPATFDARAFVVPEADVCNYFLWRQQDARRNSVQMLARSLHSHKQLQEKGILELKELCRAKGIPWDTLPVRWQRGCCIRRHPAAWRQDRAAWVLDDSIPLFNQDRGYVDGLLKVEEA